MDKYICRICGFRLEEKPWGEDGSTPTYEICPCCGVEFGNEDYSLASIRKYRTGWITHGCQWFDARKRPTDWDQQTQLKNISEEFR